MKSEPSPKPAAKDNVDQTELDNRKAVEILATRIEQAQAVRLGAGVLPNPLAVN
jgi:hypothetical protein